MTNENLEAKQRGEICFVWNCKERYPKFAVVRICLQGHRLTTWYCAEHGPGMARLAYYLAESCKTFPVCPECGGAMVPLIEGW